MKNYFLLSFLFVVGIYACGNTQSKTNTSETEVTKIEETPETKAPIYEVLEPKAFMEKYEAAGSATLVDVRTPGETDAGFIEDATLININDADFEKKLNELEKEAPIFIYCKSGGRSGRASKVAQGMGFIEIYDMKGGYDAYSANK